MQVVREDGEEMQQLFAMNYARFDMIVSWRFDVKQRTMYHLIAFGSLICRFFEKSCVYGFGSYSVLQFCLRALFRATSFLTHKHEFGELNSHFSIRVFIRDALRASLLVPVKVRNRKPGVQSPEFYGFVDFSRGAE
jgi:hypothetical protein